VTTGSNRGTPTSWERVLPFDVASVPVARQHVGRTLRSCGVNPTTADDAMLVLTELVSNSIRHARPLPSGKLRIRCALRRAEIHLEVTDGGAATRPHVVRHPVTALSGRGLSIVDKLTRSWGVRSPAADAPDDAVTVYADVPMADEEN